MPENLYLVAFGNLVLAMTPSEFRAARERGRELVEGEDKQPASTNGQEPLVTAQVVAGVVSKRPSWVYEAGRRGTIPCHRLGQKSIRFRVSEVLASLPNRAGGKAS